jgi:hypothetical protein
VSEPLLGLRNAHHAGDKGSRRGSRRPSGNGENLLRNKWRLHTEIKYLAQAQSVGSMASVTETVSPRTPAPARPALEKQIGGQQ